jgi:hypothetical protein
MELNKINYIKRLLIEGRIEDVKKKYFGQGNLRSEKDYEVLVQHDPSDNHKYLEWMAKELSRKGSWVLNVSPHYLVGLVKRFHDNLHKIEKKDLYQYNGWKELEDTIKVAESKLSKSEKKRIEKEGSEKLYEDERHLIVVPKTTEASCYYGQGTRWCTAAKKNNQFENYSQDGVLFYIIDKTNPGRDENGRDFSKLALYVPYNIIEDYSGRLNYLDHYDIELYDATDELLEDALWSDYVMSDDSNKLRMQRAMVDYFTVKASSEKPKGTKTDEKLWKAIEDNFSRYVDSNEFQFGNRWSSLGTIGFDIVDGEEKYFISFNIRTNNYDTVYFDVSIYDYDNPGDTLDKASVEKRVPIDIFMSEYDFDPRLVHWTILTSKSLAFALIKRYENKKRLSESIFKLNYINQILKQTKS